MRIMMVEPPQADPSQPYSSLAQLAASWRHAGHEVDLLDLNLQFFTHLCTTEALREACDRIMWRLSRLRRTDHSEEVATLERAATLGGWVGDVIPQAVAIFRDPVSFYNPSNYAWAFRCVGRALEVHSASAYPGRITLQSFRTAHSHLSSRGILSATEDDQSNLFLRYCREHVHALLLDREPDAIGVSVAFPTQIIPAWTLATAIRRWLPETRVVLGGATITRIRDMLTRAPALLQLVDACVLYEGETAFPALLDEWGSGLDGLGAPNILMARDGIVRRSSSLHVENLDQLPSPDHEGLPLDEYWSPEPALLLNSSRGCYHGQCAFCTISPATWGPERTSRTYRIRSVDKVVKDMRTVCDQTGASSINLSNDVLPPSFLVSLGEELAASGLPVTWDTEVRLERQFTRNVLEVIHRGGCRHLRFGFESASPRVLDLMRKGTSPETTKRILGDCRDVGITVSLMCQIGFPGETLDEALETVRFLHRCKDRVAFVSMTQFTLEDGSEVFRKPRQFGIEILANPEDEDLSWLRRFRQPAEPQTEEVEELFERVEASLDRSYPDRDLFFKGGLGHAHTTLYTARYPMGDFIRWNRKPLRVLGKSDGDVHLRAARGLSFRREETDSGHSTAWSHYLVSSAEVPETLVHIDGSLLLVLAAAVLPNDQAALSSLVHALSGHEFSAARAEELIDSLRDCGLLLDIGDDPRIVDLPNGRALSLNPHAPAGET